MRLVNYGAGEITDRLTILALKILHGKEANRDVKHFEDERNALLTKIAAKTLNGSWFESVLEIGAVNAALWYAENEIRYRRVQIESGDVYEGSWEPVAQIAFRVQVLNDRRAELREEINKKAGDYIGQEKV